MSVSGSSYCACLLIGLDTGTQCNRATINSASFTCAFPTITSQNVYYEKGLLEACPCLTTMKLFVEPDVEAQTGFYSGNATKRVLTKTKKDVK